tara:strand:- start:436 stop:855 length:420 start_codon:yes stop_codon:yes gene_type:complete
MRKVGIVKKLSHISLFSKDLKKVEKFYCKVLRLKIVHEFVNEKTNKVYGFFIYAGKNTMLEFFLTKNEIKNDLKFKHICFQVSNIKKVLNYLKKKGFKGVISRGKTDKTLNFSIKDYENNEVEFHQYDKDSKISKYFKN